MNAAVTIASTAGQAAQLLSAARYTQTNRLLKLYTPLGEDKLLAERLQGQEQMDSGGFVLMLDALSDDAQIPLKSLLGKAVRLDIQTAESQPRVWHGHVTGFELQASNGGFARYRLRVEPWLAFLRWRQDSFLFQQRSVVDIADSLFADYQGSEGMDVAWRWALADAAVYPKRGTTTQFHESDLAFLTRLLAEEGVYYWFEHQATETGSAQGDANAYLGRHTLVLADAVTVHQPGVQTHMTFQRADVTEARDTLQHWQAQSRLQTSKLGRSSWDYRSVDARPLQASALHLGSAVEPLAWADDAGLYRWPTNEQGQRMLDNAAQALTAGARVWQGESTVRTLAPATTFVLEGHHAHAAESEEERRFLVLEVSHSARNNFDEDLQSAVDQALGRSQLDPGADGGRAEADKPKGNAEADIPFYRNRFTAIRAGTPYRPLNRDGHGMLLHPKPTVHGSQSAIVVGTQGQPVHSDRDHRIQIQFHWQRGAQASARGQGHPSDEDNAPASETLGAWVRVGSAVAGDNWGHAGVPRIGLEVLVDFVGGDIDRPVVVGAVYNGAGEANGQSNQQQAGAAGATGNAPAWFTGDSGEHAHAAVYSGIKTQELQSSQSGSGSQIGPGYSQLVFDGTPGQERAALATTQAASRLHLGQHRQQADNQRGAGRGHGAELATRTQGAVRGGAGVLISAQAQAQGQGALLAGQSEQAQTQQAQELAQSLAQSARTQTAQLPDEASQAQDLPAIAALTHIAEVIQATTQTGGAAMAEQVEDGNALAPGIGGSIRATEGGLGTVTAYGEAHLQLSAPQGIALATPTQAVVVSGSTSSLTGGQDIEVIAQGQLSLAAAKGLSLYTVGNEAPANDPNTERGIKLHAAAGSVEVQSQQGESKIAAQQSVTFASATQGASVLAAKHLLLTASGAYVRLEGSGIQIHAPGAVTFRAGAHNFVGPGASSVEAALSGSEMRGCEPQLAQTAVFGAGMLGLGNQGHSALQSVRAGDGAAAMPNQDWSVDDILSELCPGDKDVVEALAAQDVAIVDEAYFEDPYYDGTQWTTKRFDAGGLQGADSGITLVRSGTLSAKDAATTLYHETVHSTQPDDMAWVDKEVEAYQKTEAWTIAKGYPSQGEQLRTLGADGLPQVADSSEVKNFVLKAYPIAVEGPEAESKAAASEAVTVVGRDTNGMTLLSSGSLRAPKEGDTYAGDPILTGATTVPRSAWKCPQEMGNKGSTP
ncbi:type VI secretion system Vgr family protein [Comamonas sp. GB3 AK4-5]|uniref:type VI secretion system Vgr family protein n=1 Tax=Comamonas sp. GB3 AK4-5 TaxID=3231487 RepID=UPI00351F0731